MLSSCRSQAFLTMESEILSMRIGRFLRCKNLAQSNHAMLSSGTNDTCISQTSLRDGLGGSLDLIKRLSVAVGLSQALCQLMHFVRFNVNLTRFAVHIPNPPS